jgi:hypothetical protein
MGLLMKPIKIENKNSFTDFITLFFVIAVVFAIGIFVIILADSWDTIEPKLNTALTTSTPAESGSNVTKTLEGVGNTIGRFNILFPLLLIGLFGFVFVTAMLNQSHPAFLFVGLIVLFVALTLAGVYSNVYDNITEKDAFTSTNDDFNIMGLIISKLPIIVLVFFVAIALILYMRSGGGQTVI